MSADGALGRWLAIIASVVVLATVVAAVVVTGTPSAQREAKLDARRVQDLSQLAAAIDQHVREQGVLPATLAVLAAKPGTRLAIVDPVTARPYGFAATGALTYRLCATFVTDTAVAPPPTHVSSYEGDWPHGIGRQCFERSTSVARSRSDASS